MLCLDHFEAMTMCALKILINRDGGAAKASGAALAEKVEQAFAKTGARVDVKIVAAEHISGAISQAASEHGRIVIAGGDGTINAAAQVLAGRDVELAVLPLGTLNHFARDLNIPTDLNEAAKLAIEGKAELVDVGEVNGRRFINNASVGLYPIMVQRRDELRRKNQMPKWIASVPAAWAAVSLLKHYKLQIDLEGAERPVVTPLLFVGNNPYSLESGSFGSRASLNNGLLSIYVLPPASRIALLWRGFRLMFGVANRTTDFSELAQCETATVRSARRLIEIALDGEVHQLALPLNFSIQRGGLKVVTPSGTSRDEIEAVGEPAIPPV